MVTVLTPPITEAFPTPVVNCSDKSSFGGQGSFWLTVQGIAHDIGELEATGHIAPANRKESYQFSLVACSFSPLMQSRTPCLGNGPPTINMGLPTQTDSFNRHDQPPFSQVTINSPITLTKCCINYSVLDPAGL